MTRAATRVVLAADSEVLAATLEASLRDRKDLHVTVGRLRALARLIEDDDPTVAVVAGTAAGVRGALEAAGRLLHRPPLILMVDAPQTAWTPAARRAGVLGVLPREASGDELAAAIAAATTGLITLHPEIFRAAGRPSAVVGDDNRTLTAREREILEMLADGLSNRSIARRLAISAYTVKFHVAAILDKLGAASRTEAVTAGLRRGLIAL